MTHQRRTRKSPLSAHLNDYRFSKFDSGGRIRQQQPLNNLSNERINSEQFKYHNNSDQHGKKVQHNVKIH